MRLSCDSSYFHPSPDTLLGAESIELRGEARQTLWEAPPQCTMGVSGEMSWVALEPIKGLTIFHR